MKAMKKWLPTVMVASALFVISAPGVQATSLEQKIDTAKTQVAAQGQKVNINTASATQLQSLPGIGAKKAAEIVAYRDSNGQFASIADLQNVKGIGSKMLIKLSDAVTVK